MIHNPLASEVGSPKKSLRPPAALVINGIKVVFESPEEGEQAHSKFWDGLIDTGSHITIVPESILGEWSVKQFGEEPCSAFNGISCTLQVIYKVELRIEGLPPIPLPKVGIAKRSYILLGRDSLKEMLLAIDTKRSRWAMRKVPSWEAWHFWLWRFRKLRGKSHGIPIGASDT